VKSSLAELGFSPLISDESAYYNKDLNIFVISYVDDFLLFGPSLPQIEDIKKQLEKRFEIKDLGPVSFFLGIQIERDRKQRIIRINQSTYLSKLLESNGLHDLKPADIPLSPGFPKSLYLNNEKSNGKSNSKSITKEFQHLLGGLMYAMVQTRPDLAYPIAYLARHMQNPTELALKGLKSVFRYIKGSLHLGITYNGRKTPVLTGYSDSDFAGDYDTRKSTSGYLFTLNNGPISWKSKRQSTISLSTTEAEFNGLEQATREAIWLKNLLIEVGIKINTVEIKGDNTGAINLAYNPEYHQRTKHTATRYYYVRQEVDNKNIKVDYISTNDIPANGLTKPLPKEKFKRFVQLLNLTDTV
jgi:hypothetical protein